MAGAASSVLAVVVVVVLGGAGLEVDGHSLELGTCKSKPGAQNFSPEQLEGKWYVIQIISTSSHCMTITFDRKENGYQGTESRELFLGRKVGLDHVITNTGHFTFKDPADPSQMRVYWPENIFQKQADVTVLDIEPDKFAVIYECQSLYLVRRESAAILSRQPTLDAETLAKIEQDLPALDLDISDFDLINHNDCKEPEDRDFKININDYIGGGIVGPDASSSPADSSSSSSSSSNPGSTSTPPPLSFPSSPELPSENPVQNEVF